VTLISAGPGCGKTVLLNEFIYQWAIKFNQTGIFLTFEERPEDVIRNLRNFDWELDLLIEDQLMVFLDAAPPQEGEVAFGEVDWFEPTLARIEYLAHKNDAKRLAVDNLGSIFQRYPGNSDLDTIRERLFTFSDRIKSLGLTTLISTESVNHQSSLSRYNVDEFVSEGLIELSSHAGQGAEIRNMLVRKLRGCGYRSGNVLFEITQRGMEVFPKIPANTSVGDTDFSVRKQFGIPSLDRALGGGIPEGHIVLIAGNTGTGKTTLGLHFLHEGLKRGEASVWVALEEPVKVVLKTAESHDWQLESYRDKGLLQFVTSPLMDIFPDKLLYNIIDAVNTVGAKRIVIDSISSMESSTMNREDIRDFLLQIVGFAKTNGVTVALNYLSGDAFGAEKGQLFGSLLTNAMRLSSIVDGIILLRYVERDQRVHKLMNVLKLRGSDHDKGIFRFEIGKSGFTVGKQFGVDEGQRS
jgi:circadian clock protein KaiC